MATTERRRAPLLIAIALLAGCASASTREDDAAETGVVATDHIGLAELRPAVEALAAEVARLAAAGWEPHVLLTPEPPHRPVVRIDKVQNRTREHYDLELLRGELTNALVEQGAVYVAGSGKDMAAVHDERAYSQSGATSAEIADGQEDRVALVVRGEVTDDVIEQDGVRQHDYVFSLRLVDTVKDRVVATTSTELRKVRERAVFGR